MNSKIDIIKGIHPGFILERELKKRKMTKGRFALSINEYPQLITSITKGKRRMNPALSLKIEKAFGMEEGFYMVLQAYYDIAQAKKELSKDYHPDLSMINPIVFWDAKMEDIDWAKNKNAVIRRIFERGSEQEIKEIIRFYGKDAIAHAVKEYHGQLPTVEENQSKYL
ncbi:MAG: Antitoxin HigA [Candidatus Ordinivivax streblomastigis]|uniref:Antitoxin HigA n=1 Tax=Candidatus Ordinivivax streblomastigis TaxID=2540710 RepID=A0A5M8NYS2_9BACT|nr:MAG: Antitoxin HigA [Candidatus Ordinivivax streblomastigis]